MIAQSNDASRYMPDLDQTSEDDMYLDILLELGSIGAGHAATALSEILQEPIFIEVPKIHTMQTHLVPKFFDFSEAPTVAIHMQLAGRFGCDILLLIEVPEAKKIAAVMTMTSSIEDLEPVMETSALHELANILIGSFLTAISDFIGVTLLPTTPESITDSFEAIIDSFLIKQAMDSDNALLFETRFNRKDKESRSILMIFPSQELAGHIIQKSKTFI